jgi:HD-GYP domain-containing protein (c-di-GMP phosphodiesterase class II)
VASPDWRQIITVLVHLIEQKHPDTEGHSQRVRRLVKALGIALKWDEHQLSCASVAALLHDVGKIFVNSSTLNNLSATLTVDQKQELMKHPHAGRRIVGKFVPPMIRDGIEQHHERWDGRVTGPNPGYPYGLKGESISPIARAIAIADAYDAMTSKRAYNKPMTKEEAVKQLLAEAGGHFDPTMVKVFVRQVVPKI